MGANDAIFCRKCGKQLIAGTAFCNKCGTKVVNESVASPPVPEIPIQQSKPQSVPPPEIVQPTIVTPQPVPETPIQQSKPPSVPPPEIVQPKVATPPTPPPVQKKPLEYIPPKVTPLPIIQAKKSNFLVWVVGILVILLIAAISGGTFFYLKNKKLQNDVSSLTEQLQTAEQLLAQCTTKPSVPGTTNEDKDMQEDVVSAVLHDTTALKGLLDNGGSPDSKDTSGTPVLILASVNNQKDIVSLLLDKGANINATAEDRETALMVASAKGYKDIVILLLSKGADVNLKDNEGSTAIDYAKFNGHDDIVNILKSKT
jgi:uncharacterized protein